MAAARTVETNGETVQVRRISWEALWKIRPDLRPANDNVRQAASGFPQRQTSMAGELLYPQKEQTLAFSPNAGELGET